MPDLTTPLLVASGFVGVGWLIAHAGREYEDAIRHTLSIFALALALLATTGITAKLRAGMGIGRMPHRIEARSQPDPTARPTMRNR